MPPAQSIRLPKQLGERALRTLTSMVLLQHGLRIHSNSELDIPLLRRPDSNELQTLRDTLGTFTLHEMDFQSRESKPKSLEEALRGILGDDMLSSLPKSMDIVGQVAIIEIPPLLENTKSLIGKAVLDVHKNVRTVLAKTGPVKGQLRLREHEVIAGDRNTETSYREYGCTYILDPTKVFFSPRLSTEHRRVAMQVTAGESVMDMFAGVGPFSILIAKIQPKAKVYAIELNPIAVRYLERNIRLNHFEEHVTPILGDAKQVFQSRLLPKVDRVIMNLPEKALEFMDAACQAIGKEGTIHYYAFKKGPEALWEAEEEVSHAVKREGREVVAVETSHLVRETAPRTWQVAVDLRIL